MLLPHMVCNASVDGGRLLGAEHQAILRGYQVKYDDTLRFLLSYKNELFIDTGQVGNLN